MTSTDEHPQPAEISALTEGALPTERSADVRGHVEACPRCADVRVSLEQIRNLLGTVPTTGMPAEVADRIGAALAVQALSAPTPAATPRLTGYTSALSVSRETEGAEPTSSDRVSRETSHPAGEAPGKSRPLGRSPTSCGPERVRPGSLRRRKRLIAAASTAAVFALGGILVVFLHSGGRGSGSQTPSGAEARALRTHVLGLIAASPPTTQLPETGGPKGDRPLLGTALVAPSCVLHGINTTAQPLAAERYTYRGTASYLVVLAHSSESHSSEPHSSEPSEPSKVDAYIVDASCASASPARPGRVLLHATYTR